MTALRIFSRVVDLLDYATQSAFFRSRANHTGTQTLATISDAGTAASRNVGVPGGVAAYANPVLPFFTAGGSLDAIPLQGSPPALPFTNADGTSDPLRTS